MALTVTPGGSSDDSLITLVDLKARWDAVGYDYAGSTDEEIERAARRGSEWINGHFVMRFPGSPTNGADQVFHFPATGVVDLYGQSIDSATIPVRVANATAEAAYRELKVPDSLTPDYVRTKQVKRQRVEGAVEREFFEGSGSADDVQPFLSSVENLLKPLLTRRVNSGALVV